MKVAIFDTETTDLIRSRARPLKDQPHIIEFFGLHLESFPISAMGEKEPETSWAETATMHSLFNPGIMITPEIERITGLNDEKVKDAPSFKDKAAGLARFIEEADAVVAHNLAFDRAIMDIEFARANIQIKWPRRLICTVEATEHLVGRRLKLIELHTFLFGEGFEGAHRAEADVRPLTRCFIELFKRGTV